MEWIYDLKSILEPYIHGFIEEKRKMGFKYLQNEYTLHLFDEYCSSNQLNSLTITKEFLSGWLTQRECEGEALHAHRVSAVRGLLLYLSSLGYDVYIPQKLYGAQRKLPHILSNNELCAVFAAIDSRVPRTTRVADWRMHNEYKVIFRIIYSCGLRISEACNLRMIDYDQENATLFIQESKNHKERIVYLSDPVAKQLKLYRAYISNFQNRSSSAIEWLFPARSFENHLSKTSLDNIFNAAWKSTIFASDCLNPPTPHDLRYTFITTRINRWIDDGENLDVMMPYLMKYVGHTSLEATHYYYHLTNKALNIIQERDSKSSQVIPKAVKYSVWE